MLKKSNHWLRAISLVMLVVSILPTSHAGALVSVAPPPADMFQLPWDQGVAWMAIDGLDNGTKRPLNSSHNYKVGGAIDFAPRARMVTGEDTSKFWVAAAAQGTVVERTSCSVRLAHASGWITEYQFLGNIQVKLGDAVTRNQRLGIIADGVRQKYCPGYSEINVPHLHFMLRPSLIGATFAGWVVNYNSFFNTTTFTKNKSTVGLYQLLMNVMDSVPTPTPTSSPTATPTGTPTTSPSPTPTLSGPYVSTMVNPSTFHVGDTALATVSLNNVPANGYTSAEFTCAYNTASLDVSTITVGSLFGTDAVTAINGPQNGKFIVAIAGSNGNKATTSGPVFTFNIKGLQGSQMYFGCTARVSSGDQVLNEIPATYAYIIIVDDSDTPTPNLTPSLTPTVTQPPVQNTPTPSPIECDRADFISNVTIPTGALLQPGAQFTKTWRVQNVGTCDWTTSYQLVFDSGEQMAALSSLPFTTNVPAGSTVDISVNMTAPSTPGTYHGYWKFKNANGALFGTGSQANLPLSVDIVVSTATATPSLTPAPPANDWLTFTNAKYGFQFKYPNGGQILSGSTDTYARINLPYVLGTNLGEKYLEVIVSENEDNCRSPLASSSILTSSETITINGLTFLKEAGADGSAGHIHKWVAYSTRRDNICVSLDFVMRIANPGAFATPPVLVDEAYESLVFGQIVTTYGWLDLTSTATPTFTPIASGSATPTFTFTPTPAGSPTPTFTATPGSLPTATPVGNGTIAGQVTATKLVTINIYNATNVLIVSTSTSNGMFSLSVPAGTYKVVAVADGFLRAEGTVTLSAGSTATKPTIALVAGDIDGNNVIDQFDALTIGMSYNASTPGAADLNNDGIINVLDLERLAKNYRQTGPIPW